MLATTPGEDDPRVVVLESVSLNRKNSLILSFTAWSKRTPVEFSEFGLDQVPMNSAMPFAASSNPFGTGYVFSNWFRGEGALVRKAASGTKLAAAGCGAVKRSPS